MGFFGWLYENFLMSEEEKQRRARVEAYEREMKAHWAEYRPKLEASRKRWAETQKELYRMGGTTALGLTESAFSFEEEMAIMQEEAEEQAQEAQQEIEDLSAELANDIGVYERDKANAIEKYYNPE